MHGNHDFKVSESDLDKAKDYAYRNREALAKIFEIKQHINNEGFPNSNLPKSSLSSIVRDRQLYVLNRLLKMWGFCTVKLKRDKYISIGKCPFTKSDSTKARFKKFLNNNPQY